jgi:lipoprotein-anchoring transpeptidase ErfK/SrfK
MEAEMRRIITAMGIAASIIFAGTVPSFAASVVAKVDLSSQTMTVMKNGFIAYRWKVSTARRGYVTPVGTYRPQRMERMWYSRKYHNSPMPHSIFFRGGYAIHGTNAVRHLGRPASHGCVRLLPANAAILYSMVKAVGPANTRIVVQR